MINQPLWGGAVQDACDVFFSYHWRDHAAVERIARALVDRGVGVFLDRWYLAPGQPWPQALEAALARCRAVAIFLGPEGLGPWQQREKDLALDRQGCEPGFPVIPVLLARSDPGLGFLKLNTWVDFSAERQADPRTIEVLIAGIRGEPPGPEAGRRIESTRATICPYRGLRPFREEDEPFFFGRAAFTETLTTTLARQSFVAVVGASGSGKSSVVRAGLIPRLRRGEGGRIWEAVSFVPTDRPLASLAASLLPLLEPDLTEVDRLAEVGKLARHLAEGEICLSDVTSRILAKQPGTERLLLFADQWEELYTLCPDEAIRTAFVAQLLEVARSATVTVVLTLRGDFYGRALSDRALSDRLQDAVVNIGPMTRDELAETIARPAEKTNLAFEPGLLETILDDVGDEPGNLPLLEFLLETLWKERRGALLHYDAYQQLGRVAGAIAHRADEVFTRELDDNQRQAAQRLLIRMVRPGEGVEDTRQRALMPEADPVAEATIRKLADARLVVTERDATSGRETVEVAHEALIRRWQRLRGWVDQDREFLRTRDRIAAQARLWEDEGNPPDRLLPPGRPLAEGEDMLAIRCADLDPELIAYIEASALAAKAEEDAARAAQRRRVRQAIVMSAILGALLAILGLVGESVYWALARGLTLEALEERWAYLLGKDLPRPELVEIPAGSFMMGSEAEERSSEPVHRVTFAQPFYLGRTEVTFQEWDACVADGECDGYRPADQGWGRGPQPVINVSWENAKAYVAWLSRKMGKNCRLPSEAEWEYAARAGSTTEYALPSPHGSDDIQGKGLANCADCGSKWDLKQTAPVGQFPANAWGVHDMHGNVLEWVQDCLHHSYADAPEDGRAWREETGGDCSYRVLRGGSWGSDQRAARSAHRDWYFPFHWFYYIGFRVVCSSPPSGSDN